MSPALTTRAPWRAIEGRPRSTWRPYLQTAPTAIVPQVDPAAASSSGMSPGCAPRASARSHRAPTTPAPPPRTVVRDTARHPIEGDPPMSDRLTARLGAGSGIAYVGLIVIAGMLGPAAGIP